MNPHTYDPNVEKVVPVNSVVLNPASGVVWEFLNKQGDSETFTCVKSFKLAQEISRQLPVPRIPEPGWGVIVEAGVPQHDTRLRWVCLSTEVGTAWSCEEAHEYARLWDDLIDPKVVRP